MSEKLDRRSLVLWDRRFLDLAAHVAQWSKDASTKVGAVITDSRKRIVSIGFNGYPANVDDSKVPSREEKLRRTIHAERNAILFAVRDLAGCTIYVTHHPCAGCMATIIQAGIMRVVFPAPQGDFADRWKDDIRSAQEMAIEAEVILSSIETL
jgi:dCMP deaminase